MKGKIIYLLIATLSLSNVHAQMNKASIFEPLLAMLDVGPFKVDTSYASAFGIGLQYNKSIGKIDSVYLLCHPSHDCPASSKHNLSYLLRVANTSSINWRQQAKMVMSNKVTFILPVFVKEVHANPNNLTIPISMFWQNIWMPLYENESWPKPGLILLPPQTMYTSSATICVVKP
ncbi:MAG TPA: hypothetical protein PKD90_12650 [Phnomibacter sp.]|nr:hypothetical protein [Phnomibacter sp.]